MIHSISLSTEQLLYLVTKRVNNSSRKGGKIDFCFNRGYKLRILEFRLTKSFYIYTYTSTTFRHVSAPRQLQRVRGNADGGAA
jgi:hypothetical protein